MPSEQFRGVEIVPFVCYYVYPILCILLIILGTTFKIIFNSFSPYIHYANTNFIIWMIIATGCLNILYNFVECFCGTRSFTLLCFITFPLLLLLQGAAFGYGFYQTADYHNFVYKDIYTSVKEYKTNISTRIYFSKLEERMDCCGLDGPKEYLSLTTGIPTSCCPSNPAIGSKCTIQNCYQIGCATKVYNEIIWLITILSSIILLLFAVQVFTGIFLCIKTRHRPLGTREEFLGLLINTRIIN